MRPMVMRSLSIAGLVLAGGCGGESLPEGMPSLQEVRVTVLQNGSPVSDAVVMFEPVADGQRHASGTTDADGVAVMRTDNEFDGVPAGEYAVKISKNETYETGKTEVNDAGESVAVLDTKNLLPEKYASFATSGLKVTISNEPEEFEFDLVQ